MNQRIQELADRCWNETFHFGPEGPRNTQEFDYEKFAMEIVRDCLDICETGKSTQMTSEGVANHIRNHFGVKE